MKKYSRSIIVFLTFFILILILLNKSLITNTITTSLYIWYNTLVPSMFPMFVLSDILITYDFANCLPTKFINFLSKLFHLTKSGTLIFLLSLISGFPTNAISIKTSYDMNLITKEEAEHLLLFCHFPNPLFVLETVGNFYLKNNLYGIIILLSLILSNIIIGITFRKKNNYSPTNYSANNFKSQSFGYVLSNSVKKAINSLLMIGGTVTIFLLLSTLIINIFHLNNYLSLAIQSILEMTMALSFLSQTSILGLFKVIIATSIIAFGGLSIHMQVISSLDDKIKYRNYFFGRLYQIFLSGIISFLLFTIFIH